MSDTYEAIIIGAGHNGLACACHLAKAGLHVLVLERHYQIGGMTRTEEITLPGFLHDVHAAGFQLGNLSPSVEELHLIERGFELIYPPVNFAQVFPDGRHIRFCRDLDDTCASIAQFSRDDANAWREVMRDYHAGRSQFVQALFNPPVPGDLGAEQCASLRSWIDQHFESEEVKTCFAAWGIHLGFAPDDDGGIISSSFGPVIQDGGNNPVLGGMQQLPNTLAHFVEDHGGEVRTSAEVEKILTADGRATGVRLATGEEIRATRLIASNANPVHTILDYLTEEDVGSNVTNKMRGLDLGVAQMTIFMALERSPSFVAGDLACETLYVHAAEPGFDTFTSMSNEALAGKLPRAPLLLFVNEGSVDPSRAPSGKSVMRILVGPLPYEIRGDATGVVPHRTWETAREPYANYIIALAERHYVPGLGDLVLERVVHDPVTMSIESPDALGGSTYHVGNRPEQTGAMRPIPELGQYRTPVANVYLCGAGSHPGGGVSMAPGRNAAITICDDLGLPFHA
ncbi:MAG: NAD(P)/FAD-dependent oxidoreductase [Polyangiales bacterium]